MKAVDKIRKAIGNHSAKGMPYARACQIWKGYSSMGQRPYGWYYQPFGEVDSFLGSSVKEVIDGFEDQEENRHDEEKNETN